MSSFISSSRVRRVAGVLLLVVLGLAVLEASLRLEVGRVSKDFEMYASYPARANRLAGRRGSRVALVGNSALREGVDLDVFRSELESATGGPAAADSFYATHSHINTWRYMMEHYFWRSGRAPDLIAVIYFDDSLADGKHVEIGRLAWCLTDRQDWPEVLGADLPSASERADYLLSAHSVTWAMRDRIKDRVLALATPGYAQYEEKANAINYDFQSQKAGASDAGRPSHEDLRRLLERARARGTRICFVAFPTLAPGHPEPYELSTDETRMIRDAGMALADLRHLPELTPDMYDSRTHLNAAGRPLFSRRLARALADVIRSGEANRTAALADAPAADPR